MNKVYRDAFDMLCGNLLGEGATRKVYECNIRDDLVVKVEYSKTDRYFTNVMEMKFWCEYQHTKKISEWLAPCEFLSPDGRILLQKRCQVIDSKLLPNTLPFFLADIKRCNFGSLDGRIVCMDYAGTILNPSVRMRAIKWD